MKIDYKVIIYGVRGQRKYLENCLANHYEIIGYSDSDERYSGIKKYDYKPFYSPENLINIEFDYIIINSNVEVISEQIMSKLMKLGIKRSKIIETVHNLYSTFEFVLPIENYLKMNKVFPGLIFGMSYSYSSLLTYCFDFDYFKLSYLGADLYYHYSNIKKIKEYNISLIEKCSHIIFDLPYYAFNWDLSKAKKTIQRRMGLLDYFKDYHNYGFNDYEKLIIKEYQVAKDMFSKKSVLNKSSYSNNFESYRETRIEERKDEFVTLEHVWERYHWDTIDENKEIFKSILKILTEINPNIRITIVVYPFYMEYMNKHILEINKMKNLFYDFMEEIKDEYYINIIDCMNLKEMQNKRYYKDANHLNGIGAYEFSKWLNKALKERL